MRWASILLLALILGTGCHRRVSVNEPRIVLDDRAVDIIQKPTGDVKAVLESNLPPEKKVELVGLIYSRRLEALKEVLLRESQRGSNIVETIKNLLQTGLGVFLGRATK